MAALVCCEEAGTKFVTDGAISKLLTGAKLVSGGTAKFNSCVPRGDLLLALAVTQQQQTVKEFSTTKRSREQRKGLLPHHSSQQSNLVSSPVQPGAFVMESATSFLHNLRQSRCRIPQQVSPVPDNSCWQFNLALQSSML